MPLAVSAPARGRRVDAVGLLVAIAVPFALRGFNPDVMHRHDVTVFAEWAQQIGSFRTVYVSDCFCNYPIVGLLASAGALTVAGGDIPVFLWYLAAVESVNAVAFFSVLRSLQVRNAGWWTALFALLPSTLAGGALWGQIDHVGLLWCLLIVRLLVALSAASGWRVVVFSASIGVLGYAALFTKQLMVFPLFPLAVGTLSVVWALPSVRDRLRCAVAAVAGVLVPFLVVESVLARPEQYAISHYQRVLDTGSDHIDTVSDNGANIWVWLFPMRSAASAMIGPVTVKQLGIFLFAVFACLVTVLFLIAFHRLTTGRARVGLICGFVAVFNLTFNVWLTGSHERYLFYCYPFLLVCLLVIERRYRWVDAVVFAAGTIADGCLVYGVMRKWPWVTQPGEVTTLLQLAVSAVTAVTWLYFSSVVWPGASKSTRPEPGLVG